MTIKPSKSTLGVARRKLLIEMAKKQGVSYRVLKRKYYNVSYEEIAGKPYVIQERYTSRSGPRGKDNVNHFDDIPEAQFMQMEIDEKLARKKELEAYRNKPVWKPKKVG